MRDDSLRGDTLRDDTDDTLEAGLRAAFGGPSGDHPPRDPPGGVAIATAAPSVVATLAETVGARANILLRDAPDEQTPVVRPRPAAESGPQPWRSHVAGGRYQVAGEIARGGVGIVLKSRDVDLGRDVAMKVLRPDRASDPAMVQRFVEEAQIAGQLQHPGILPVYELGLSDARTPFFTMKLVKGKTLAALLQERRDTPGDGERFLAIFEKVCETLAYAHAKGVIHRDLKPSNIMVGAFGEVQVVDWGLAKVLPQGGLADEREVAPASASVVTTVRSGESAAASLAGSVMGTPAYMPPEQANGQTACLNERCDVFSLGAILCEILTGQPPYSGPRELLLRQAQTCAVADALTRLSRSGAGAELVSLAHDCLSVAPNDRPRDAGNVADRLATHRAALERRARRS